MITLRRSWERHTSRGPGRQRVWLSFYALDRKDPLADGFGALEILSEDRLPPRTRLTPRPPHAAETVTYVREGALAWEDSTGLSGTLLAGEFRCATTGEDLRTRYYNPSSTDESHVFQIWLRSLGHILPAHREHKRFTTAERRGRLCAIASANGAAGSLRVERDAVLLSALLDHGQHLVHELKSGRIAWLHVLIGSVTIFGELLRTGDGVGVSSERTVSFTAVQQTEILMIDLAADAWT